MALKIGINGFGRIGRLVLRAGASNPNLEFVGINDIVPADNLAYLLKHDSTHGMFPGTVEVKDDGAISASPMSSNPRASSPTLPARKTTSRPAPSA